MPLMIVYILMNFYFNHIKIICKKLQWEGGNIGYYLFLIGVFSLTLHGIGQALACNQVYHHCYCWLLKPLMLKTYDLKDKTYIYEVSIIL
jgi:hypothetical protein